MEGSFGVTFDQPFATHNNEMFHVFSILITIELILNYVVEDFQEEEHQMVA